MPAGSSQPAAGFGSSATVPARLGTRSAPGRIGEARLEHHLTVTVRVTCDLRMSRRWDETADAWEDLGKGELLIARGLGDTQTRLPLN